MSVQTETSPCADSQTRLPRGTADPKPLIYIAAPYTQPDPAANTHYVLQVADALLKAGATPLVPHLSLLWHVVSPKPYDFWLAYDRELLIRCDAVMRIPGFSNGATDECRFAESLDIPVLTARSAAVDDCVRVVRHWISNREGVLT
ncbi:hypothetical protein Mal4_40520 [Maioricimonas rarisocia]|uniref:DUF7768 domain-containing protein n=1 Tax=Maioricimonas rarisocia TaxID=2528026 RepID=A0A517ZB32_9PLAN|nr:DUF4406 domain-containing protein [Maioricimonas rarisocia]QDU39706.1 hypothetical protein Mal4_40520 [Maioricimonas rarisocia]